MTSFALACRTMSASQREEIEAAWRAYKPWTPEMSMFVAMPMFSEYAWRDAIISTLTAVAGTINIKMLRTDMDHYNARITQVMEEQMHRCDLYVADVAQLRPNVLYELGYLANLGKRGVVICPFDEYVPAVELLGLPVHSFSDRAELQRMLEKELAALRRQLIMERYPLSWLRAESKAMTLRSDLPLVQPAHREDRLPVLLGKYPHGVRGFTHSHIIQSILVGTPLTNIIDGAISTHRGTVDGHLVVQREQIGSCDTEIHVMPNGVLWLLLYLARDQVEALMSDNGDTVFTAALAFIEPVFVEPIYVFLSSISQMRIRWLSDVSMSVLDFSVHPGAPIGSIGD